MLATLGVVFLVLSLVSVFLLGVAAARFDAQRRMRSCSRRMLAAADDTVVEHRRIAALPTDLRTATELQALSARETAQVAQGWAYRDAAYVIGRAPVVLFWRDRRDHG